MLSDLVVCYLFLGGAGAGTLLVLCALALLSMRAIAPTDGARLRASILYRRLLVPGFASAFALLALGAVCLAVDLGSFDGALLLFVRPRVTHLTVGAWALAAGLLLSALSCAAWSSARGWRLSVVRALCVLGAVDALATMAYTGLLLGGVGAVPLWASPWLPALFAISALSCGAACVIGAAHLAGAARLFPGVLRRLAAVDAVAVVAEVVAATGLVTFALAGGSMGGASREAAVASAEMLVAGPNAWLFWGGFALAGLVVPFALDLVLARAHRPRPYAALAAAASVLVGGFVMRWCVVVAGAHPALQTMGVM
ncbi:polysulfide reductase [Gordonibacter sp. An230]|uniref:NrfD/PsrC family molybdoenzyme membrane anchor subunit n=1 Tax=Gordonibacter sp. An230 TaxID=1965592 RepID=UPI000B37DF00|nr:NrfD/PsrC family molybdoenzyme membrane anchor subunit [Gordonibacter sp. An230]OUO91816.1 polysulfide reductase [Gordonibacter sp. An230]